MAGSWVQRGIAAAACLAVGCTSLSAPPAVAEEPSPPPEVPAQAPTEAPSPEALAEAPPPPPAAPSLDARVVEAKGWSWIAAKLVADGVELERVERSFADPRIPAFDGLFFAVEPAEPRAMYRAVLARRSVAQARACASEYARAFLSAERSSGVPAEVLAAILHVETRCGRSTGESVVLFGLARLAMANEPANVAANIARRAVAGRVDPDLAARVRARAAKLEEMFYPEVRAVFTLADLTARDPLELRGSGSGAFGVPQFLPTSYLRFGTDGNHDGRVDLYDVEDAAASAANFLASHGWQGNLSRAARRRVIWHYNRSEAYIDAVLGLADRLEGSVRAYYVKSPADLPPVEAAQ
jgi:peptidoglycan lytic transglycosylase B